MRVARLRSAPALWASGWGLLAPEGGVAVAEDATGKVLEIGRREALRARHADVPVEEGGGLLLPGFVDCHAHLELGALRGKVPGGDGLAAWVGRLLAARAPVSREELQAGAMEAARDMRAFGTIAVADVCTLLATKPILEEAGLGGVSLLEVVGANQEAAEAARAEAEQRLAAHPPSERVDVRLVPHSPHGTHPEVLRGLVGEGGNGLGPEAVKEEATQSAVEGFPEEAAAWAPYLPVAEPPSGDWPTAPAGVRSVHVAEHDDEERWHLRGEGPFAPFLRSKGASPSGKPALATLEALGVIGSETLLVHLVTASEKELERASTLGATAVLCPRSNLHIGGKLPDLERIRRAGLPWTLGTDSLASTPDHDLLGELRVLHEAFPSVPFAELLAAATHGGAAALGLRHHPWVRIEGPRADWLRGELEKELRP